MKGVFNILTGQKLTMYNYSYKTDFSKSIFLRPVLFCLRITCLKMMYNILIL